jgi:hypothetical protein
MLQWVSFSVSCFDYPSPISSQNATFLWFLFHQEWDRVAVLVAKYVRCFLQIKMIPLSLEDEGTYEQEAGLDPELHCPIQLID